MTAEARKMTRVPWDTLTVLLVLAMAGLGLVMLLSASSIMAEKRFGNAYFFFRPQMLHMTIGLTMMLILQRVPYQVWVKLAYPILTTVVAGLFLVLVPGIGKIISCL